VAFTVSTHYGYEDNRAGLGDLDLEDLLDRPAWHAQARCANTPDVNFFPTRGESVEPARQVCAACPVMHECQTWALAQGVELVGVWGALSDRERRQRRRDMARAAGATPRARVPYFNVIR